MRARLPRPRGSVAFAVLATVADVVGHTATRRVDRALHVRSLAPRDASYYPFLLVGVKIVAALALAALLARFLRARSTATAGHRLLDTLGHRHERRAPRLRPTVAPHVWLASFAATAIAYLVQSDAETTHGGGWGLLAPWLHTYALPVLALLSVLVALAWSLCRWVRDVEDYAVRTLARVRRILSAALRRSGGRLRPADDRGPRRRFGLAFESRPPPLAV